MWRSGLARTGFLSDPSERGRYYFDIDLFTGKALDLILPHLQIEFVIRDGLVAIGTTIGKLLNYVFSFRLLNH